MAEPTVENPPAAGSGPPPPPLAPIHPRRPRVREVSSRFMSPVVSSSSSSSSSSNYSGDSPRHHHHLPARSPFQKNNLGSTPIPNLSDPNPRPRSSSANRRRRQLDMEQTLSSSTDENNRPTSGAETDAPPPQIQSSDPPLGFEQAQPSTLRRQRSVKLLKENIGNRQTPVHHPSKMGHQGKGGAAAARLDTPVLSASFDRTMSVASRFRGTQPRSASTNTMASSAAAKLLQSSVMSLPPSQPQEPDSVPQDCRETNHHAQLSSSVQSLPDLRSSGAADSDPLMPAFSGRTKSGHRASTDSLKLSALPSPRYLNSPFISADCGERATNGTSKLCLPPVPPGAAAKLGTESRKAGKKVTSHQEDAHSLKLLHNRYLQWRFANARAEASAQAQQRETETKVNSLRVKMSEMYDSVIKKRIELGILQRTKTLSAILEAQVPCLDQWCDIEEDYSVSLAESSQALLNASVQLPLGANVRVDVNEFKESLNSAMKVMESMVSQVQHLVPKAEETEILMSELAKIVGGERALVEECGDLLSRTNASQVDECSLRCQIIQLHSHCSAK